MMRLLCLFFVAALWMNSNVFGQEVEYPFIPEELPPHLAARVAVQGEQLFLTSIEAPSDYFIAGLKRWNTQQPIRGCFFGGSTNLRSQIMMIAMQWAQVPNAYVPLDFGSASSPRSCSASEFNHIRIGFAYKGYWSMVGTDSVNAASQLEQSMNFYLFDINPPNSRQFAQIVLHEFGHALGFQHEHQSPIGKCEFDWDKVYAYLASSPNFWSREQIDRNMKPRNGTSGVVVSPTPDRSSIMLYSFPRDFYKSGVASECYTPGNFALSEADKLGLRAIYPEGADAAINVKLDALDEYYSAIDALALPNLTEDIKARAKVFATDLSRGSFDNLTGAQGNMFNGVDGIVWGSDFSIDDFNPDFLELPSDYLGNGL